MIKIDGKASKDLDREVLLRMNDRDLLTICQVNKYFNEEVCNDQFFHTRLLQKYPDTVRAKPYNRSYKNYYLDIVYNISILKDNFYYDYTGGNPMIQVAIP